MIEQLEKLAAQNKLSLNQLVIQCLNYAISNLEISDEDAAEKIKPDDGRAGS